ncbi:hypothetical protein GWI33_018859 [Rhynchophorus ferrugineus]|uniref:Invertebrate defensins family profile domain-containing protein n=1 Tax=Rhynchophorus ferrugineus TaxID=354439 RepID=A0A834M201_RHYFE|nr:hypothetical protein GWI33_018859 [Rhynchophorus ferrugineus]
MSRNITFLSVFLLIILLTDYSDSTEYIYDEHTGERVILVTSIFNPRCLSVNRLYRNVCGGLHTEAESEEISEEENENHEALEPRSWSCAVGSVSFKGFKSGNLFCEFHCRRQRHRGGYCDRGSCRCS